VGGFGTEARGRRTESGWGGPGGEAIQDCVGRDFSWFITGLRGKQMGADKSGGRLLAPAFGLRPVSPALWLRGTGGRGARLGVSRRWESGASSTRSPNAGATSNPPLRSDGHTRSSFCPQPQAGKIGRDGRRDIGRQAGRYDPLSPLLRKAQCLGLDAAGLERLALQRGCDYYRSGEPIPPTSVSPGLSANEELAIALLHPALPYHARTLRLGTAMREEPDRPAFAFSRGIGARSPRSGVKPPG